LIYSAIASLDGYVTDEHGRFDWAEPPEEVHAFVNELERPIGTYLYGRRLYEVMAAWEEVDPDGDAPEVVREFARIWQAAEKIVFSRGLDAPSTLKTRIEREFDPQAVTAIKASSRRDLTVGGPGLAKRAIRAGLVDELHLVVAPVVVGGGTRWLPDGVRIDLELLAERHFDAGFAYLRYRAL
jgi:dihydrofolate reductase